MAKGTNKRNVGMTIDELKNNFQYGMHGCGFYKGTNHVNSLEALRYWREQGVKVMEIDIAKTIDGKFVALAHLMNPHYLRLVEINPFRDKSTDLYTEKWFMRQRLCTRTTNGLTPMNLSMIASEMANDSELVVMFDLWRMWEGKDTKLFSEQLLRLATEDIKERCVLEVYNKQMLEGIREADPRLNVMYCVHGSKADEFDENVNPSVLKDLGIDIISYPWHCTKKYPGEIENYHKAGFTIFSLSRNNSDSSMKQRAGVNVNIVDLLYTPKNFTKLFFQRGRDKLRFVGKKLLYKKMDRMTIEEVHSVALEMMKEIHDFCIDNNIQYSLAYGSLIGAIRHKGFIPWDDDIDIWMTRSNFEKFTKSFKSKKGFRHSSIYDKDSLICFDRVYETNFTFLESKMKSCNGKTGVWVDIMPLDNVPDDDIIREKQYQEFLRLNSSMIKARSWLNFVENCSGNLKRYKGIIMLIAGRIIKGRLSDLRRISIYNIHKDKVDLAKKYSNSSSSFYCFFQCGVAYRKRKQELLKASSFDNYILTQFEDTELMIVKDYDNLLKSIYGDYLTPPPIGDRQKSHGRCFWK